VPEIEEGNKKCVFEFERERRKSIEERKERALKRGWKKVLERERNGVGKRKEWCWKEKGIVLERERNCVKKRKEKVLEREKK
jgi:hypothetical protein